MWNIDNENLYPSKISSVYRFKENLMLSLLPQKKKKKKKGKKYFKYVQKKYKKI